MPPAANPVIAQKLADFGVRWRRLVLWRGISGGVLTLLGSMTLVAFIDLLWVLPDGVRWGLSAAGYVATVAVIWWYCLRWLFHAPSARELARLVEKAEPGLREDLLSAVELAENKSGQQWDSEIFRALLQEDVGKRVRFLDIESVLPRRLIAIWVRSAIIAVVLCVVLFFLPGLHYDRLIVRAFAPGANVERVSRVKIRIVEPRLTDPWQPLGDNLPIVVEISGPEPDKVVLESFTPKGDHEKTTMGLVGLRQYSAAVPLGVEGMEFRVRAGDAITKRIAIKTRPRPHVVRFDKTFQYPEYSLLKPRHVVEENGDLSELEGTHVELRLEANQTIKEGELILEQEGETNRIALTVTAPRLVQARVPLLKTGTYRVRLVAAETGFENKFSPMYEIHPLPDLVPHVGIDFPKQDLVVPPEEVVNLRGSANDDIGLAKVSQLIQINDGGLNEIPLLQEPKTNAVVGRKWDLLQLGVSPGDRIMTKLVAIDLRGSRVESAPLHLVVSSVGLDGKRLRLLESKRALRDSIITTAATAARLRTGMSSDTASQVKQGDALLTKQLLLSALATAQELEQRAEKSWIDLKETIKLARDGRDASDLALIGRGLSVLRHESLADAKAEIESAVKEVETGGGQNLMLRQAIQTAQRVSDQAAQVQNAFTDLLASDEADAIAENLGYLGREQERMNRQADEDAKQDRNVWERLARREGGAAKEAQMLEEMLKTVATHVPKGNADRVNKARNLIAANRTELEKALEGTIDRNFLTAARKMQKGIDTAATELRPISKELAGRADKARDSLNRLAGTGVSKVERLRRAIDDLAAAELKYSKRKPGEPIGRYEDAINDARAKSDTGWKTAIGQLKDRADVEEMRHDTDPYFVADAGKTSQALSALRAAAGAAGQSAKVGETLKGLEKSFRLLEGVHSLHETAQGVKAIGHQERWEAHSMDALVTRPRDWTWTASRLKDSAGEMKKAGLPDNAVNRVTDAARSPMTQDLEKEMTGRQALKAMTPLPDRAEKLYALLAAALTDAEVQVNEARNAIGNAAPKLSDMLAGLAQTTDELEKNTRKTSQETKQTDDESRGLLEKQQDLNKQLEELKESIRRDANLQDLAKAEGRERSRDADDAVAMLREPPAKAEEALRDATNSQETAAQKNSLAEAADQQKKLGETLKQLAQHYQKMEAGSQPPEGTRTALRQAEEELGIKTALDEQYKAAEKLAEMEGKSLEQMLAELEKELLHNEVMRSELNSISKDSLETAKDSLDRTVRTEKGLVENLQEAATLHDEKSTFGEKAQQLGAEARKLAQKELPGVEREAASESARVKKALADAAEKAPSDAKANGEALALQLNEMTYSLELAAKELREAAAVAVKKDKPSVKAEAEIASEKAAQVARDSRALSERLMASVDITPAQAVAQAAGFQIMLAKNVERAGSDIERSGRHGNRLGTAEADDLKSVGTETQKVGEKTLPATRDALAGGKAPEPPARDVTGVKVDDTQANVPKVTVEKDKAPTPADVTMPVAQAALKAAEAAVGQQLDRLTTTLAKPMIVPPPGQAPTPEAAMLAMSNPAQSKWMARTLDELDAAMHAKPKDGQNQEGGEQDGQGKPSNGAKQAAKEAAKAQKNSMMAQRAKGTPGQKQDSQGEGDGEGDVEAQGSAPGSLPPARGLRDGEWGKLPPKLAQGLMDAQREGAVGEYRKQVETYFKVVAEKARDKKP